jgi:hypothetical protein
MFEDEVLRGLRLGMLGNSGSHVVKRQIGKNL